jgi:hypothetical protein
MSMLIKLVDQIREEAEAMRLRLPLYAGIVAAMTPLWTQVEGRLRARFGRQAVVHRADGMIVVEGVTGHPVCAFIQVLRVHMDVEYVSAARRRTIRVIHSSAAPLDRLDSALRQIAGTFAFERLWAAVDEPEPFEDERS